jgi:hypothetical protein
VFKAYTNSNANSLCYKDLAEVGYVGYYGNVYISKCAPNVVEKNTTKGVSPTGVFRSLGACRT